MTALAGGAAPNQFNSYVVFLLGLPTNAGNAIHDDGPGVAVRMVSARLLSGDAAPDTVAGPAVRILFLCMTRATRGLERHTPSDPTTNLVLIGRRGGNPDTVGIDVSKRFFALRAWALRIAGAPNTRWCAAGTASAYDPLPFSRPPARTAPGNRFRQNFYGGRQHLRAVRRPCRREFHCSRVRI